MKTGHIVPCLALSFVLMQLGCAGVPPDGEPDPVTSSTEALSGWTGAGDASWNNKVLECSGNVRLLSGSLLHRAYYFLYLDRNVVIVEDLYSRSYDVIWLYDVTPAQLVLRGSGDNTVYSLSDPLHPTRTFKECVAAAYGGDRTCQTVVETCSFRP